MADSILQRRPCGRVPPGGARQGGVRALRWPWLVAVLVVLVAPHATRFHVEARAQALGQESPASPAAAVVESTETAAGRPTTAANGQASSGPVADATTQPPLSVTVTPRTEAATLPKPPPVEAAVIAEQQPELFYLENEAGRLVPVPGFQYRDFVELLRLREGMPKLPTAPEAVLERLEIRVDLVADPQDSQADASNEGTDGDVDAPRPPPLRTMPEAASDGTDGLVTIELTVMQASNAWVSLPLNLGEALLTEPPVHETLPGPTGRFLLDADADRGGYRGWFHGEPGTRHRVVLRGRLPVERAEGTVQMAVDLPRANASRLSIRSPLLDPAVSVEPSGLPPGVQPDEQGSVVSFVGLVGPTRIRLSSSEGMLAPVAAAPQASVELVVTIDGRQASTKAVLQLDQLPRGRRTFTIQLPPRARLESLAAPTALVTIRGPDEAPEAVVTVDPDANGRAVIEMVCETPLDGERKPLDVLGFGIREIPTWRQWGQVSVLVQGDWQLNWDPAGPLRRIDPSLALRREGCVAAFAFDAQPASLPLEVRPLESRVVVEPEYRVRVSATRAELVARLQLAVRGAPISQLRVGLEGWDVEEAGPPGLVDGAAITEGEHGVDIPFRQGLTGDAVVEIRASRPILRDAERVEWSLPVPEANVVGPAAVIILPESDIELTPDAEASIGLVRQVAPTISPRDADRLSPLTRGDAATAAAWTEGTAIAYRLDGKPGRFAASRRYLPRRVAASLSTRLDVGPEEIAVEETVRFDVAYVPLEVAEFSVPERVTASGTLEVRQGDRLLASQPATDRTAAVDDDTTAGTVEPLPGEASLVREGSDGRASRRMRVMLPTPLLGTGELVVRYRLPTTPPPAETTLAEEVPFVMPLGVRFGKQSVALESDRGLAVEVRGEPWKREMAVQGTALPRNWVSSRPQETVRLAVATEPRTYGETVIDAAWLQTRLLPRQRQDIFRYRLTTSAERLDLVLPEPSMPEDPSSEIIEVLLNGRPVVDAVRSDRKLVLNLPTAGKLREYSLEIVTRHQRPAGWQPVLLEAPEFPDGAVARRFYWELRLPPDEHLMTQPGGWTSQQEWAWDTVGLAPRAIISPEMLQAWIEPSAMQVTTRSEPSMPSGERRMVFSGLGQPEAARLWILPTWLLVAVTSGPMLVVGLVLVQWPLLRRPAVIMLLAVVATAAAAVFPWWALLVGQAALPGLLLTCLAAGLRVALRPAAPPQVVGQTGGMVVSQSSTRTALAPFVPESSRATRGLPAERSAS